MKNNRNSWPGKLLLSFTKLQQLLLLAKWGVLECMGRIRSINKNEKGDTQLEAHLQVKYFD